MTIGSFSASSMLRAATIFLSGVFNSGFSSVFFSPVVSTFDTSTSFGLASGAFFAATLVLSSCSTVSVLNTESDGNVLSDVPDFCSARTGASTALTTGFAIAGFGAGSLLFGVTSFA